MFNIKCFGFGWVGDDRVFFGKVDVLGSAPSIETFAAVPTPPT